MTNDVLTIARQIVYDGNLYHGVSTWLLLECCTGSIYQYLSSKGGVIDFHVELEELVVGLTTYALANQIHTMAYIVQLIYTLNLKDMRLIASKIGVGFDGCRNCF